MYGSFIVKFKNIGENLEISFPSMYFKEFFLVNVNNLSLGFKVNILSFCLSVLLSSFCRPKMAYNVLRLCVCLPLAQSFNLTTNLMGQIAQNRCYLLGGLFSRHLI